MLVHVGYGFVRQDVSQCEEEPDPLSQQEEQQSHWGGAADEVTLCSTGGQAGGDRNCLRQASKKGTNKSYIYF